jgi:DNA-binding NtrC family response regulator
MPAEVSTKPRVLVVDDDRQVLKSLERLLEVECDVRCVESPAEALKLAMSETFEVILTDFRMQQMTGAEFAHAVKERVSPAPSIIMLTGTPDSVTHATPGSQDLVVVMAKPFDPARLLRMVVQVGRLVVQRHAGSAT